MPNIRSATAILLGFVFSGLTQAGPLLFVGHLGVLQGKSFLKLPGQLNKNLLYVVSIFSRTLHINQVFLPTELFYFLLLHLPLVNKVRFVANQKENGIFLCIGLHLVHPKLADIFKAEGVCEIKYKQNALAASVVSTCYGPETLLACRIPNLEFHVFGINLYSLEPEVDSYGR